MATPKRIRVLNKPVLNSARPLLQQWLKPYRPKLLLAVFAAALSVPLFLWQMCVWRCWPMPSWLLLCRPQLCLTERF